MLEEVVVMSRRPRARRSGSRQIPDSLIYELVITLMRHLVSYGLDFPDILFPKGTEYKKKPYDIGPVTI